MFAPVSQSLWDLQMCGIFNGIRLSAGHHAADLAHERRIRPGLNGVQVQACRGQQALAPVHVQLQGGEGQGGRAKVL